MSKNSHWYGLNLLPIYIEIVESQLDAACEQLNTMQQAVSKPDGYDSVILTRLAKWHRSQNADNWVFFEQCKQWRNQNPDEEQFRLIAQLEKLAARLELVHREIALKAKSLPGEIRGGGFDWLCRALAGNYLK